jgi:hypothetical protein
MKKHEMSRVVRLFLLTAGILLVMLVVESTLLVITCYAQGPTPGGEQLLFPPYTSPNERLGFGLAGGVSNLADYDVAQLNAGWYTNWGTALNPPHPAELVYVQVVRLKGPPRTCLRPCSSYRPTCEGFIDYTNCIYGRPPDPDAVSVSPSRSTIQQIARANPGSVWLIGNEPDRIIYMDDVCPDEYALVYHELYHLIKEVDPTAKIAVGGVVQTTPIRLQYLDIVMCAYEHTYGTKLPADLWNVHAFILNEEAGGWGCDLPPGMVTPSLAQRRNVWDCDDMSIFKQQIHDFRQWMADHGERDKPLIVSEYGILMPEKWSDGSWFCDGDPYHNDPLGRCAPGNGRPYDYARVTAFMQATFDYFLGVDLDGIDASLGYPADGNRLMQAWNWYSLNEDWMYNGNLFHSSNKQITALGVDFRDYATPLKVNYKDLLPWELSFEHPSDLFAGDPVTVTISSEVFNMGNEAAEDVPVRFWDGQPGVGTQLGLVTATTVLSRYQGAPTVAITWPTVATNVHDIYVEVNPEQSITETIYTNNTISATLDFKSDLTLNAITFDPPDPLLEKGQEVTITISAQVQNVGHLAAVNVRVRFWDGDPGGGGTQIGDQIIAPNPADPLGRDEVATAQITWTTDVSGTHEIYVRVDPDNAIGEIDEGNNERVETIWLAVDRLYFPLIFKNDSAGAAGASVSAEFEDGVKIRLPTPTP